MDADGRWKVEDELSLSMGIFLVRFSQLTNCESTGYS